MCMLTMHSHRVDGKRFILFCFSCKYFVIEVAGENFSKLRVNKNGYSESRNLRNIAFPLSLPIFICILLTCMSKKSSSFLYSNLLYNNGQDETSWVYTLQFHRSFIAKNSFSYLKCQFSCNIRYIHSFNIFSWT